MESLMALSDTSIRNAPKQSKPYKLSDSGGLFLLINPTGTKWWRYSYRFNGKQKTLSLGVYPDVTLKDARAKHQDARSLLSRGVNPSEDRKQAKLSKDASLKNSFEFLARAWIDEYQKKLSQSHKDKVLRRFELYLFPWIGKLPIDQITAPEVLSCIKRIQNLNKLETAHRTLQAAGQVFRYAVQHGIALRDVTADLRGAIPAATVKHMAAFTEPSKVAELLRAIDGFTGTYVVQVALKLAPLVFVRPGELRTAKWADIDLEAAEWKYRVSKTNTDHIVPLSSQALEILKDIQRYSGSGQFVFTGGHDPKKPMSDAAINAALKRMGYDTQTQITGHGFRAMARTILHERLNIDPVIIEHQLAHRVPDALGAAYNRTKFIDQRKLMMQKWADYLDELKAGTEIVSIGRVA
jgi:integrase